MNPTNEHREQARGCTRLPNCASMTHWSDCKSNPDKRKQLEAAIQHVLWNWAHSSSDTTRELLKVFDSTLSSRDTEVREVLDSEVERNGQISGKGRKN